MAEDDKGKKKGDGGENAKQIERLKQELAEAQRELAKHKAPPDAQILRLVIGSAWANGREGHTLVSFQISDQHNKGFGAVVKVVASDHGGDEFMFVDGDYRSGFARTHRLRIPTKGITYEFITNTSQRIYLVDVLVEGYDLIERDVALMGYKPSARREM